MAREEKRKESANTRGPIRSVGGQTIRGLKRNSRISVNAYAGLVFAAVCYLGLGTALTEVGAPAGWLTGPFTVAAALLGPSVALGGAFGIVLLALSQAALGTGTFVVGVEFLSLALVTALTYGRLGVVSPNGGVRRALLARAVEYLCALLLGTVSALAALTWLVSVAEIAPYYVGYSATVSTAAVTAVLGVAAVAGDELFADDPPPGEPSSWSAQNRRTAAAYALVGFAWFVGATGIAVLAHDLSNFTNVDMLTASLADTFGDGVLGRVVSTVFVTVYAYGRASVAASGVLGLLLTAWLVRIVRTTPPGRTTERAGSERFDERLLRVGEGHGEDD
ncbi:hypothetical protein [Salinigranum marinum]|uniref:hypothetical protein n=1 Tax=Salinigranum marinum TaxID=1515595 RepID=UPI002989B85B|nr:hypothetical protein [Salinigranum marinum]